MNPIDDLIKFLSSNPYADNKTIFNKFPQLSGNAKLATRAKAYVMGVSSGEYNRNDLDENFSDVVGMFTPKNMDIYKGIDKIHTDNKSVEPTRNENQQHGNAGGLTKEQAAQKLQEYYANQQKQQINEDDPIGSEFNNLHQQKQYIQSLYSNRDATSQKINPMQTFEASNEMSAINAGIKRVLDYQNNGVPVNTNDAKDWLNEQIKKNRDDLPDVDGLSIQEIAKNIPQTLTNKSVLKTYEKSRNVFDAIKTSNTIQQAALRWGRMNPKYEQDIMLSTGEVAENNPNVVNKDLMRDILIDFIKQPATVEWAYKNPENLKTFRIAYNNLESTYPELRKTRIVEAIQNEREKMGNNSGWYNSPGKETTDNIVDNLSKSGVLNAVDVKYYKDEIRPKLGFWRGVGRDIGNVIPIVQTFVNDDPLHTPGILENMSGGYKDILHKTAKGLEDISMLFTNISNNDAISSKYQLHPQFKAKSGWHELTDFGGKMIGELIPIITTGVAGKIVGASEKLSTGIGFALSALDDTVKIAKTEFPNDAFKQIGYTGLMTAFNVALGYIIPDGRPKELTKGIRDDIKNVISNFTDGTITKEAAMKSAKDVFYNLVSEKAPEYISKVAEHNLKGGTFMTAPVIIDHALKKIFGGQSENEELNAGDVINNFMLGFLASTPLSALSAHGDISNKRVVRESIWNITGRPEYFKNIIKGSSFKNNPDVIENLQTALMVREELDGKTELTNHQKKEYLLQSLNEKVLQKQLDNTTDSVLKEKIKERINQSKEIRENILTRRENQLDRVAENQKEKTNNDNNQTQKEPEILQTGTVGENNGRGEGNIPDGEGGIREAKGAPETAGETAINAPTTTDNVGEQKIEPYVTKNEKYSVVYEEGKRVVKDNDGNIPSENIEKKVLSEHAENFNYNNKKEIKSEQPQFKDEQEANLWTVENSQNPSEIADVFIKTPKEQPILSTEEQAILDYGIGKITEKSYREFGDGNHLNNSKARAYISSKGRSIDVIAKEISDHTGLDIQPQHIVDFIDRFPSGPYQALSLRDGAIHTVAKQRFEEMTGIPLTDKVAKMAAQQHYTPEAIKEADSVVDSEPLPEVELNKWLEEESKKIFEENNNLEYESSEDRSTDNGKPQNEGNLREDTATKEGGGVEGDIPVSNPESTPKSERKSPENGSEVRESGNPIINWLRKTFTSNRGLPDNWMALQDEAIGFRQYAARNMRRAINDLKAAIKTDRFSDSKLISDALSLPLNDPNNTAYHSLPNNVRLAVANMRGIVDGYSESLVVNNLVTPSQAATIQKNLGQYLNRAYKLFTDRKWKDKVPKQTIDDAVKFISQQRFSELRKDPKNSTIPDTDLIDKAIKLAEQDVQDILTQKETPVGQRYTEQFSKDLSTLKKRQDIPAPIRKLMGEYTDPITTFAITVSKLATLHSQAELLHKLKSNFSGILFFGKDEIRPEGFNYEVASDGSQTWNPLSGLYTSKQIVDIIQGKANGLPQWLRLYQKGFGVVKKFKTVYSIPTQTVNFFSNPMISLANGHFNISDIGTSWRYFKDTIFNNEKSTNEFIESSIKHNIIGQSVNLRMIRDMLKNDKADEFALEDFMKPKNNFNPLNWIKSADKTAMKLYGASDSFWKMYGFMNEIKNWSDVMYNKEYKNLTPAEKKAVNEVAGERIKNTYPTYDRALPGLMWVGKNVPFIGNFMAFQAEVLRTVKNNISYAIQDLKSDNVKIKALGAKRIAGIVSYAGLKVGINYFVGMMAGNAASSLWASVFNNNDDDKTKRSSIDTFLPEYLVTHNLMVEDKGDGIYVVNDIDRLDPYNIFWQAANSLLLKENGGIQRATNELAEPFIEQDMIIKAIGEIRANKDLNGYPIYNPADDGWMQTFDKIKYLYRVVEPTTLKYIDRVRESDNKSKEAIMSLFGARGYNVDIDKSFKNKLREAEGKIAINQQFAFFDKETSLRYRQNAKDVVEKLHKAYQDAIKLGVPIEKLDKTLNKAFYSLQNKKRPYIKAIKSGEILDIELENLYPTKIDDSENRK